jgi:Ankyrin repeats (3 copies)
MGDFEKLIEAAQRGNVADVRAILHRHTELINQRDQMGATALHHAAFGGHRGVVQALVEQGAEINAADSQLVRHLQGGRSNICVRWADCWRLNWTTLPMQYSEVRSNGLHDSSRASLLFVERLTLKEDPSSCLPSNLAIWKSRSCLIQTLLAKRMEAFLFAPFLVTTRRSSPATVVKSPLYSEPRSDRPGNVLVITPVAVEKVRDRNVFLALLNTYVRVRMY